MARNTKAEAAAEEPPSPAFAEQLFGHGQTLEDFRQALAGGRMPHAWLFAGLKGIGKATLAYHCAREALAIPAEEGAGESPGGGGEPALFGAPEPAATPENPHRPDAPLFRQVASGAHPDFMLLERSADPNAKDKRLRTAIVIGQVRAATQFLRRTSSGSRWKVLLVDSADDLNVNAANALLKVLEEPPGQAIVLLVSHSPGRLLPTIRSRVRSRQLRPLSEPDFAAVLQSLELSVPDAQRSRLSQLCEGSAGRAVQLLGSDALALDAQVDQLWSALPNLDQRLLTRLAEKAAADQSGSLFSFVGEALFTRMTAAIRTRALSESDREAAWPHASIAELMALWEKMRGRFSAANAVNLDRKQTVLTVFLELAAFRPK